MSSWLRVGLAILAVALLAYGGLLMLRARLEQSPALREALVASARAQIGARLEPGTIHVGLRKSELVLSRPVLELHDRARLVLGEVRLGVDLGSLLAGRPRVRSATVSGTARLESGASAGGDGAQGFTLQGPLQLALREVPGAPAWSLDGTARPESGGTLELQGRLESGGFVGAIVVDGVESAPFAPLLASEERGSPILAGAYDGTLELSPDGPDELRLASRSARIGIPPLSLDGPVALVVWLPHRSDGEVVPGRFQIDASGARVAYAGTRVRASGRGASVGGRILRTADGHLRLEGVGLHVEGFAGELGAAGAGGGSESDAAAAAP